MRFRLSKKVKIILIAGVASFVVISSVVTILVGMWVVQTAPALVQASRGMVTEVAGQSTQALQQVENHPCANLIRQSLDPSVWLTEPIGPRVAGLYQACLAGEVQAENARQN